MPRAKAHEKHLYQTRSGVQAHIRIGGVLYRKHFKRGTELVTVKQWLLAQEMRHRTDPHTPHTFRSDAKRYLDAITAMPTYAEREGHILEWVAIFEDRPRADITADQIRAQLHAWRASGKAASTVNHRRTALMHLYSVLDGKSAANPVKDVPRFREPAPIPRALSAQEITRLIRAIPKGPHRARAQVIAYTGIPHAQLMQLRPSDFDPIAQTIAIPGRRKGHGTLASIRPLTSKGVAAFTLMKATNAWGPFDRFQFRRVIREACASARITPPIRPYDLRHFFGTELYRRSGDVRAVQVLMGHSSPTLTHRYTLGAVEARIAAAVAKWR